MVKKTGNFFKAIWILIVTIIQALTVNFYKSFKFNWYYYFDEENTKKLDRNLSQDKMVKLLDDRLKRVERLVYAVYEDPSYSKSHKGEYDIKELKRRK